MKFSDKEEKVLEGGIEMSLHLQPHHLFKVSVVNMDVDPE